MLPEGEELSNEREYPPITGLNSSYKIYTGIVGKYMNIHVDRHYRTESEDQGNEASRELIVCL